MEGELTLGYDVESAQKELAREIQMELIRTGELTELQCAAMFSKILIKQTSFDLIAFCEDDEMYISKTPMGYDVVGFYFNQYKRKIPFSISVTRQNGVWLPAQKYIAADTKSCSSYIWLWVLLSVGCTLMGILMYYLMSAAIGI